ncbi:non-ribosomal peptide synthetase, partial [Bacillus cereus group sp. N14]
DLVAQLREKCLNAFDNQEYPFEELVDQLGVEREPSRNPIFDIMFTFENKEMNSLSMGDYKVNGVKVDSKVAKFDITVTVIETSDGYDVEWEYCTDLFKEKTIARMNEQFVQLLK